MALVTACVEHKTTTAVAPVRRSVLAASTSVADPAAEGLHEISGRLLVYYARHQALPPSLEALAAIMPDLPPPVDPESNPPLVYHVPAVDLPGRPGDLLLYAPGRNRHGGHWAVLVKESADRRTLTTQVVNVTPQEIAAAGEQR